MYPTTFHPQERVVSPPQGKQHEFSGLRVVDCVYEDGQKGVISCWLPTPEDLERLNNGGGIYLVVLSQSISPTMLTTSPEDAGLV
ncbi:MAG: hypothetical protein AAGA75_26285 [Cyanobacteria bacterium P01_E01_bin.6]